MRFRLTFFLNGLEQSRRAILSLKFGIICVLVVLCWSAYAADDGDQDGQSQSETPHEIEVLVVTGTLIRTQARNSATPLTSISKQELDSIGASDVKDILRNLSFNASSLGLTSSNWLGDDGSTGNASVNVRNLGNGSTLVLLNGKRVAPTEYNQNGGSYVDVQGLVPNIALARIDVLKDGASAIYGADAVAGVANLITRNTFTGFELESQIAVDHESGEQQDTSLSSLYGGGDDKIHFILAASYLDRSELGYADRFERFGQSGLSSFGQPGRFIPQVGIDGPIAVERNYWWPNGGAGASSFLGSLPDLECQQAALDDGPMGTLGIHPQFPHICVYDYSSFFAIIRPETQLQTYASLHWHVAEEKHVYMAFSSLESHTTGGNSFYPDVRYVIVPEHNLGLQLDAARRGFEPVEYQGLQRILGGTTISNAEERPVDTQDEANRSGSSFLLGIDGEFDFFGTSWYTDVSLTVSNRKIALRLPTDTRTDRMNLAFAGLGGPSCDSATGVPGSGNLGIDQCFYYNPFQTSVYDPVTGARWQDSNLTWAADASLSVGDAARKYRNPNELLQWLQGIYTTERSIRHTVFDAVSYADIAEFRGSSIGLALGAQVRRESTKADYDELANQFGYSFLSGNIDWENSVSSWSIFSELRIPISQTMELTAALRNEHFDKPAVSSLDPKVSFLADLSDSFTMRMSWGTSFKVGSLLQTGGSRTIFRNSSDPFSNAVSLAYRSSQARGNPDLTPEVSETFSGGFTWEPTFPFGVSIDVDWYQYEYSDLIIREGHQELIDRDNVLRCPNGVNGDPQKGPVCGVWDHDHDGIATVFSIGTGLPNKVIRREDGYLVRTDPLYLNANNLSTSGIDFAGNYEFGNASIGDFRTSLSLTRYLEYSLELQSGEIVNGLGKRNAINPIARPMPKSRARLTLDWSRANQSASLSVNSTGGYRDTSTQTAFLGAYIGYADYVKSMTTIDGQYSFRLPSFGPRNANIRLTLGAKNLMNREPPLVIVDGAYDYFSHDPRGRIYYLQLRLELAEEDS